MDRSGASCYIYAKTSAKISNAFVQEKSEKLFNAKSVSELWSVVFKTPAPVIPEILLANKLETKAVETFVQEYNSFLDLYSKPDEVLVHMLQRFEILNLKAIVSSIFNKEPKRPGIVKLGKYSSLNYDAWPDLKKITAKTEYSWINECPQNTKDRQKFEYQLDLKFIQKMWKSVNEISDESRKTIVDFFKKEYSIQNMLWALRLKVYYNYSSEKIIENLFYVTSRPSVSDPICSYAFEILDKNPSDYSEWTDWRFSEHLNFHEEGQLWKISPSWIEQRIKFSEVNKDKKVFHQEPMTDASMIMYFRIKMQELNCIRAATEGIRLNADPKEAMLASGAIDENGGA